MSKKETEPVGAQIPTTTVHNALVQCTTTTVSGNELLEKPEQQLYYLIIQTSKGKCLVNIGQKTHDRIFHLLD
nr:MAG: hypothetical protein [Microviridae sp.]